MEITKFSSQCFAALEQVTVNVRRALNALTVWGKTVPEKTRRLQESYRASDLRKIFAGSLDAIVETTHEIAKFRPQLVAALQQVAAHIRRALSGLAQWRKGVPEKTRRLQETYRASNLQKVLAGSLDAIAATTHKITKFRPQLVAALQQVAAHVRQAQNGLAEWGRLFRRKLGDCRNYIAQANCRGFWPAPSTRSSWRVTRSANLGRNCSPLCSK